MNRRDFLLATGAATAGLAMPFGTARASVSAADTKFLFVFNAGGWDPTRVFAPEFDNANVDMEVLGEPATAGGISFVAHEDRPSVSGFMNAWHERMLVMNGVQVRSIAHDICTMLALTGGTSGLTPDWATLIAGTQADRYTLPHLVLGGPSFPGDQVTRVARSGLVGQLDALLSGEIVGWSDAAPAGLATPSQNLVDRYLRQRASAGAAHAQSALSQRLRGAYADALDAAVDLKDFRYVMEFAGGSTLLQQAEVAADALSLGLSRCVTMAYPGPFGGLGWDSHATNDDTQSDLFEGLFANLARLMELLETTPGEVGNTLADETVVVVLSEMGRTPQLNATAGKDHWPYTSMMIVGEGFTGDRVVGGFDPAYYGHNVDLESAEVDPDGRILSAEAVGGALLAFAGLDPAQYVSGADPLLGILA